MIDVGRVASEALGNERPGLGDLLAGDAAFGEVIQRDDDGARARDPARLDGQAIRPMQRMQLVIGALTHTYDKVIVVADKLDDWPDEYRAARYRGDRLRRRRRRSRFAPRLYDVALARGAHSALIVRYTATSISAAEESAAA